MYRYEQFKPGDLIRSDWANKLENLGLRLYKFQGVVANEGNLPPQTNVEEGTWQIVLEPLTIVVAKSGTWQKISASQVVKLTGDVVGVSQQVADTITIPTEIPDKIVGAQLTGDVVGSGHVQDNILFLTTQVVDLHLGINIRNVEFTYSDGRITQVRVFDESNVIATVDISYDADGRVQTITRTASGKTETYTLTYLDGKLTGISKSVS